MARNAADAHAAVAELFGGWGSGKSCFLALLHNEVATIKKEQDEVFHRKVVQIHFNAWHYLDTNLLAYLVCEIIDNLLKELKQKLVEERAVAAEARKAFEDAKKARAEVETKLTTTAKEREEQEHSAAVFLDDLKQAAENTGLQAKLKEPAADFRLGRLSESYTELEKSAEDARSLAGRPAAWG